MSSARRQTVAGTAAGIVTLQAQRRKPQLLLDETEVEEYLNTGIILRTVPIGLKFASLSRAVRTKETESKKIIMGIGLTQQASLYDRRGDSRIARRQRPRPSNVPCGA